MKICVVDYDMGNLKSVTNALTYLGFENDLISNPVDITNYDTIILPGVGAFGLAMEILKNKKLDIAIIDAVKNGKKIIGICLGMQLLFEKSFEFGENRGLGLIKGEVIRFTKNQLRVPHMGWNKIKAINKKYKQFESDYYFVHSYYCVPKNQKDILFETNYGFNFCSAINNNNIFGFQFHPEKSQKSGLKLLKEIITNG